MYFEFHLLSLNIAEQAQDEELEKQRKEQELRKKKEAEDSLTLEQTKDQVHYFPK